MPATVRRSWPELLAGLDDVRRSPRDRGSVALVVRRPDVDRRELLASAQLSPAEGLVGDGWRARGSRHTPDGSADPDRQLTLMNARVVALLAAQPQRQALAGDQLYVDIDLSEDNVPAGTRLAVGRAVVEVTDRPHLGCAKFGERFGVDALRLVNSAEGRRLRLRGVNARVVVAGVVRPGDPVVRLSTVGGPSPD